MKRVNPSYLQVEVAGKARRIGWIGPWPPPEKLALVEGKVTPDWTVTDPAEVAEDVWEATTQRLNVTMLRRQSASLLTDEEYSKMTHVSRGALYVPDDAA